MSILAIILSLVAVFVIGFVWYGPLFGKAWMFANNIPEDADKNMKASSFALNIFGSLLMIVGFYYLLGLVGAESFREICFIAFVGWVAFIAPSLFDAMAWKNVHFKGFLIDGVYRYVSLLAVGAIYFFI